MLKKCEPVFSFFTWTLMDLWGVVGGFDLCPQHWPLPRNAAHILVLAQSRGQRPLQSLQPFIHLDTINLSRAVNSPQPVELYRHLLNKICLFHC